MPSPVFAPPWRSLDQWHEANWSVDYLIKLHGPQLNPLATVVHDIKATLDLIFPMLDDLCAYTCPWCPDPCCLTATVWFDLSDLLFMHLTGQEVPPSQPQQDLKISCRYIGPRGCTLPRIGRPWICSWYLCDSQLNKLRKKDPISQDTFGKAIQDIKAKRKEMEEAFISMV